MTQLKDRDKDYTIGLDIGTNSTGWVAMNKHFDILKLNGKTAIGARLFEEGHTAADRRLKRTTRRRLKRRKWRLRLLEKEFEEVITKVDPEFFIRQKESFVSPKDKTRTSYPAIIFPTVAEEKEFHETYPTIYHLRNALMTEHRQFDIREVYAAIHHIIKYRGNFLESRSVKAFRNGYKLDIQGTLEGLHDAYQLIDEAIELPCDEQTAGEIKQIIEDEKMKKLDKQKEISNSLQRSDKSLKPIAEAISKAIFDYKVNVENLVANADLIDLKGTLSDETFLDKVHDKLDDNQEEIFDKVYDLFNAIYLSTLIDENGTLSTKMISKYDKHKEHLELLKSVEQNLLAAGGKDRADKLKALYNQYVNNRHYSEFNQNTLSKDDFYKGVQKALSNDSKETSEDVKALLDHSKDVRKILEDIERDQFMPKQRTNRNGSIPVQLHQVELDKIIENQAEYYPFLAEKNPVEDHRREAPYKLDELLRFRVPYYVGPMVEAEVQQKTSGASFAWMVRKDKKGEITPWNFEQKVDKEESATRFISRMTVKDTYLLGEDVLPAASLIYQKYVVLDELNKLTVNGKKLADKDGKGVENIHRIYRELFKNSKKNTVNKDQIANLLGVSSDAIGGVADIKSGKLNSNLSTYHKLRDVYGINVEDKALSDDIERIIKYSALFEDKEIFRKKLNEITWLSNTQKDNIAEKLRLKGWGRLSKRLLVELRDANGRNIIDNMWDTGYTFMTVVNKPEFKELIKKENDKFVSDGDEDVTESILKDAYTSPANKKAIRQVVRVVDDIVKAASGQAPSKIAVEFARSAGKKNELTDSRWKKLSQIYRNLGKDVNKEYKDYQNRVSEEKIYLYILQNGRDAYTGKGIDIDNLAGYDVDHIIPQSFVKDDSIDNKVLVSKEQNNQKSDAVPKEALDPAQFKRMEQLWQEWLRNGQITKQKYNNLTSPLKKDDKYKMQGFIRRQLVETSQIVKLASIILKEKYPNSDIIVVKASFNHELREAFKLYKSRSLNDYHHAIDAYLSAISGNFLYYNYPSLRRYFVYGDFKQIDKETRDLFDNLNFLSPITGIRGKDHTFKLDHVLNIITDKEAENKDDKELCSRDDLILKLRHAYNFKYMLVSQEVQMRNSKMWKETILPAPDHINSKKAPVLYNKKKDLPSDIYGGYTNVNNMFMAIVKIISNKGEEYRTVTIPAFLEAELGHDKDTNKEVIYDYLKSGILSRRGVKSFEVIVSRVPFNQLIQDEVVVDGAENKQEKKVTKKLLLNGSYVYNAKQLWLDPEAVRILTHNYKENEENDSTEKGKSLNYAYAAILEVVNCKLPLFDTNKFRDKLRVGEDQFKKLSNDEKEVVLEKILNGLHDNPVMTEIKEIGMSTKLGMMQFSSGLTLSSDAVLINQSPTGLFEKRIKLSDL